MQASMATISEKTTMSPYETELAVAQKAYNSKDYNRSVAILRKILKRTSSCFPAEHMLAKIEFERGNSKLAKKSLASAIERAKESQAPPDIVLTLLTDYVYILSTSGDYPASNEVANQGLELRPDSAQLLFFKAYNLRNLEIFGEAVSVVDRLLSIDGRNPDALCERGQIYLGLDRDEEALDDFKRAADLAPKFSYAHYGQAEVFARKKRYDEALELCKKALSLNPFYAEAYTLVACCLLKLVGPYNEANEARLAQALDSCNKAIELKPDHAEAYSNRGNTLNELGRLDEALASHNKAIELKPGSAEAYSNRGNTLNKLGRLDEALASHNKAIELKPGYAEAYNNRGNTLNELGRLDEAIDSYNKAIEIAGDNSGFRSNKGLALLLSGQFEKGWENFEFRTKQKLGACQFTKPLWSGRDDLSEKTILIHPEQGLGDVVQFSRYTRMLEEAGARVLFDPYKKLRRLMKNLRGSVVLVDCEDISLSYDYHCPIMSLPFAFETNENSIPCQNPYLAAEPKKIAKWAARIGSNGYKIGICWQGSKNKIDTGRSFPLVNFASISRIENVRLISLHKGAGEDQLRSLPLGMEVEILGDDFDAGEDAFIDTAAAMKCCDLVITSDTAVAHLAGALGVPVWVALKRIPDWRYMLGRMDSPWYPTMRLFRQKTDGDWNGVFEDIERALFEEMPER
jgi:tetratricopeptide (TPR) repeat protein